MDSIVIDQNQGNDIWQITKNSTKVKKNKQKTGQNLRPPPSAGRVLLVIGLKKINILAMNGQNKQQEFC